MGFVGLNTAVSGLRAAQTGLSVTGHNMSNSEIYGYSRQRVVQKDFAYTKVGMTAYGPLKRGLGTDWNAIQQIRNEYLDVAFRENAGRLSFYSTKMITGMEIESLLGELQGAYNFQSVINNMWYAIQELTTDPSDVGTRNFFLATCHSFVTKANETFNSLIEYQFNLDRQIREAVVEINKLITEIKGLNDIIRAGEVAGDNANDYRDQRNVALDRLSEYIPINYYYDYQGNVGIFSNGVELLSSNYQSFFGFRYCTPDYPFVIPVITHQSDGRILAADTPPSDFQQWFDFERPVNAERGNDHGILNGLIVSRGAGPAYHMHGKVVETPPGSGNFVNQGLGPRPDTTNFTVAGHPVGSPEYERLLTAAQYNWQIQKWSAENGMIPKTMMKLDEIFNSMVRMINDTLAPTEPSGIVIGPDGQPVRMASTNGPYDNRGNQSLVEVFTRKDIPRWAVDIDPNNPVLIPNNALNTEEAGKYRTFYSIGNVMINPKLLDTSGGYNFLALSDSGDQSDTRLLKRLQEIWQSDSGPYSISISGNTYSVQRAYKNMVNQLAAEVAEAKNYVAAQTIQVNQAENKRQSIMGVSLDEEMNHMMKYQYAYQSAARILNVIDSMLDKVINGMGRAGL
jgi:flagellar hook-associated protein 1 FlgK